MNKNAIIVIVVLLLALLAGGYYMMKSKTNANITDNFKSSDSNNSPPKSLKELLGAGSSQKCTFDKGEMYIADGKVRGNFDGGSHMIVSENTSYIWTDDQTTGFRTTFDLDKTADVTPITGTEEQTSFDYAQAQNYNCASWKVDKSVFDFPLNIEFQDMSKFVDPPKPEADSSESQCSYCDALTGDSITQCLTSLNCN